MSTLEMIYEELKTLPPPKLAEAATLIHRLRDDARAERLATLERTAGAWRGERGAAIEKAIVEACEKIEPA
jgi:hypothetical protein